MKLNERSTVQENPDDRRIRREQTEAKREKEKQIVDTMIQIYCKHHHSGRGADGLCEECRALSEYARLCSEKCPFMEEKTFCNNCKVHCYTPKMRERIKKVMRYSGPRMLWSHPVMVMYHVICTMKEKRSV